MEAVMTVSLKSEIIKIPERVARGTATLDRIDPEWRTKVDTDKLRMASPFDCVLGQLYSQFGCAPLSLTGDTDSNDFRAVSLGFHASMNQDFHKGCEYDYYDTLTSAWKKEIQSA